MPTEPSSHRTAPGIDTASAGTAPPAGLKLALISVHVPRCAGTSMADALVAAYGAARVYHDNSDRLLDPNSPANRDRQSHLRTFESQRSETLAGKLVAHGHLWIKKYDGVHAPRAAVLRHPVDRVISHYFYWKAIPRHGHSLHDRFLDEQPSLLDFARIPGLRHFYTETMFRDVDMSTFDLIGATERMDDMIAALERLLGRTLDMGQRNQALFPQYQTRKEEIKADAASVAQLRDLLADEIAFYERHTRS